jgi:hypothetical protein
MVVVHLSIEFETGRNDYPIILNSSQRVRNDISSQQTATAAQGCARELNSTQIYARGETDTQQI